MREWTWWVRLWCLESNRTSVASRDPSEAAYESNMNVNASSSMIGGETRLILIGCSSSVSTDVAIIDDTLFVSAFASHQPHTSISIPYFLISHQSPPIAGTACELQSA